MMKLQKVWALFSEMPRREKITVAILAVIFAISLGQFIAGSIRLPVRNEKGVFAEGFVGEIKILNPLFVDFNETDRDLSELIFSGLIRYDPVKKNFFPDLAESWQRSKDGLIYTFKLRPTILWHDSEPLTTEDILFTFRDIIQDPGFKNPLLRTAFEAVAITEIDPQTIRFTLPRSNSYFITNLTTGILPKHALQNIAIANLEKSPFGQHPIGTGPYRVMSLRLDRDGDRIDLAAFPAYYGEQPTIDRLRIYTFPNEEKLLRERSALHALGKVSLAGANIAGADPRFTNYSYILNQFTALVLNTTDSLLKEKKVRQALARALNKNELLGEGEQRVDMLDLKDHSNDKIFSHDINEANKLLDSLGLKMGSEGFRTTKRGETLRATLLAHNKIPQELIEKIRNSWQTLGIQITIQRAEGEEFIQMIKEGRYSALLIRQNLGYNRDVYALLHSSQVAQGGLNFSRFKSFRTDGLTEAIRREKDPKAKEKLLSELSKIIAEEIPFIFLSTPVYTYSLDKRVQTFPIMSLDFHSDRFRILPYLSFLSNP